MNKSPGEEEEDEEEDEDLPSLEEAEPSSNPALRKRNTLAAAAERRMYTQQDPTE